VLKSGVENDLAAGVGNPLQPLGGGVRFVVRLFHHANEELLFVISGAPSRRRGPDEERVLEAGEVVGFPVGLVSATPVTAAL
jgi:uncharacterized cupin superfamily protein